MLWRHLDASDLVTMSDKELNRINVIQSVVEKRMRRRDAAHQLALTERQTQRLMNRFRESSAAGLANLRRGRPGNHRLPESLKLRVLSLLHDNYSDFGPTLAAEKLRERHNITVSVETLRKWMTADGLWVPYSRRRPRVHQPIVHNTTYEALRNVSPLLASRSGLDTGEDTLAVVATKIAELITV